MEALLKELLSASKLLNDLQKMYDYESRLKTFADWPFVKNCKCTPENASTCGLKRGDRAPALARVSNDWMAKAGFIHCQSASEPDVAKCFFCLIELEGWEPNDDPREEHAKRHSCGFLSLSKRFDDLTMEEYYMLEMTRLRTFLCKTGRSVINAFEEEVAATRKRLVDNFVSKHGYTPRPPAPIRADPTCRPSESSRDESGSKIEL